MSEVTNFFLLLGIIAFVVHYRCCECCSGSSRRSNLLGVLRRTEETKVDDVITLPFRTGLARQVGRIANPITILTDRGDTAVLQCQRSPDTSIEHLIWKHHNHTIFINMSPQINPSREYPLASDVVSNVTWYQKYGYRLQAAGVALSVYNVSFSDVGMIECWQDTGSKTLLKAYVLKLTRHIGADVFRAPMISHSSVSFPGLEYFTCAVPFPDGETEKTCCASRFIWRYNGAILLAPKRHPFRNLIAIEPFHYCQSYSVHRGWMSGHFKMTLHIRCNLQLNATVECWYLVDPDEDKWAVQSGRLPVN